ncbi:MAG: hypothetical protein AABZ06_11945 [Bdellovibrionota bacterium]
MKYQFLFVVIGTLMFSQLAFANHGDPFDIVQDGYRYHCVAESSENPVDRLDCVEKAYAGPFSRDEAQSLCSGAFSVAPAECALSAYSGIFSRSESITLCTHAVSVGPADCAKLAYSGPFSRDEALRLCARDGTTANAQCAIRAYAGPYSREEAISICKTNAHLINMMLTKLHNESIFGFDHVLQKSRKKAEFMKAIGNGSF